MSISIKSVQKLPNSPGVYFFLNKSKKILYIGKATSLKDRAKSYFAKNIGEVRSPLISQMINSANSIDFKATDSVLEALILEADLIKKFHPEFNTKEKDDKSFNCVIITDEDFPIVKIVRKKDIDYKNNRIGELKLNAIFGPYPEGGSIREGLKIIRKIFPYKDEKCKKNSKLQPCFNYQIGLCPGTCMGKINKKDYSLVIRNIKLFLQGKKKKLLEILKKEMKNCVDNENFELAAKKRNQIFALEHIQDVSLLKKDISKSNITRIEAYDIAHMSGKDMVGVMVVMENGNFVKSQYRKFLIKNFQSSNDTGALKEVLERRFRHSEWTSPDLIIIDGGQAQLNVCKNILIEHGLDEKIKIVSTVKDNSHKVRKILGYADDLIDMKSEIIKINAESHRYAIEFHKKRRNKAFISKV